MKRIIINTALFLGAFIAVLLWRTAPAKAQLGNLDNCEAFYRLAKAAVHEWDYTLTPAELAQLNKSYDYSPMTSLAYSNLHNACIVRNAQLTR